LIFCSRRARKTGNSAGGQKGKILYALLLSAANLEG